MTKVEKFIIQNECQNLLNNVSKLMDTHSWEKLAFCYLEDSTLFRPSDPKNALKGRDNILSSFKQRALKNTSHILSNFVFKILSETLVQVSSKVVLYSSSDMKSVPAQADSKIMIGSFDDTLCFLNDKWYIKTRKGGIELRYE